MSWDPNQYLAYADERALPFHHLVAAVAHLRPRRVLDIGCGPGALTATLLERWPEARILGIDSSDEMIELCKKPPESSKRTSRAGVGNLYSCTSVTVQRQLVFFCLSFLRAIPQREIEFFGKIRYLVPHHDHSHRNRQEDRTHRDQQNRPAPPPRIDLNGPNCASKV